MDPRIRERLVRKSADIWAEQFISFGSKHPKPVDGFCKVVNAYKELMNETKFAEEYFVYCSRANQFIDTALVFVELNNTTKELVIEIKAMLTIRYIQNGDTARAKELAAEVIKLKFP